MKKEQFDESVNRALYQASRNLELNETLRYLEKDVNETERKAAKKDSAGTRSGLPDGTVQQSHQYSVVGKDGTVYSSFELKTIAISPGNMPKAMILRSDRIRSVKLRSRCRKSSRIAMFIRKHCWMRWFIPSFILHLTNL